MPSAYDDVAEELAETPGEWLYLGRRPNRYLYNAQVMGDIAALRPELGYRLSMRRHPGAQDYDTWGLFDPALIRSPEEIEAARVARSERWRRKYTKGQQ